VVIEISSANNYAGFLVTKDFLDPSSYFDETLQTLSSALDTGSLASAMKANISSLTVLDNTQCLKAYDVGYQSAWSNLLIVMDTNTSSSNWLGTRRYTPSVTGPSPQWLCENEWGGCDLGELMEDTSRWQLQVCEKYSAGGICLDPSNEATNWVNLLPVKYCLAETAKEHCSLEVLPELLLVVLICNALKIVLFSTVLRLRSFHPVAIIGDAFSSFLESPDSTTTSLGSITARDAEKDGSNFLRHRSTKIRKRPWKSARTRWGRAVKLSHWICLDIL